MATKKGADASPAPALDLPPDHPLNLARETSARRIDPGDWVKFEAIGDGVVGKIVAINPPSEKVRKGSFDLQLPDGTVVPVGKGGTLYTQIREDLLGHWVGVYYVGDRRIEGKPQPMKVYEVHDFGPHECPAWAAEAFAAE